MLETLELKVPTNYSQEEICSFFERRGWPVTLISATEVNLIPTTKGAALECADGRFDDCPGREMHGPRVFGQVNALLAMLTGGSREGLTEAARILKELGYMPGTHGAQLGGCGYFDLWAGGRFTHTLYPNEIQIRDVKPGLWLRQQMKLMGGKHFRLNGIHIEEGARLNPFVHTTEAVRGGNRFRVDDWLLALVGIPLNRRCLHIAEAVEKLKPDAAKLEILVLPHRFDRAA